MRSIADSGSCGNIMLANSSTTDPRFPFDSKHRIRSHLEEASLMGEDHQMVQLQFDSDLLADVMIMVARCQAKNTYRSR